MRRQRILSLGLMVILGLAACGSDDGGDEEATTGPAAQASTTIAAGPSSTVATQGAGTATVAKANDARFGAILVDGGGLTLYTFDQDTRDDGYGQAAASACSGACAQTWPPLLVPAGTVIPAAGPGVSGLGTLTREDGASQVTVNGKALYRYAGDTKPRDTNGEGIGGVWHVAKG